jgi:hypothetical protein
MVDGAQSYADWVNGDLYEHTEEQFSICTLPGMSETVSASFISFRYHPLIIGCDAIKV